MEGPGGYGVRHSHPCHPTCLPSPLPWDMARSHGSPAHFIEQELLLQVEVGALAAQVLLHQPLHALLLQAVCHIVEGVLVWEGCQRLSRTRGTLMGLV